MMPELVAKLATKTGISKKQAEIFVKTYFGELADALEKGENVKIKEFGAFKLQRVEERKSVNVSTGEELTIPAHNKVVFVPSKRMAENVNQDFNWLDIVEISQNISPKDLDNIGKKPETKKMDSETKQDNREIPKALTEKEEEQSERLGEELEREFGDPESTEPFGPIDPGDPEPGEPIPADTLREAETAPATAPEPRREREFDPYAHEPVIDPEEHKGDPFYLTVEEAENLATKSDFRLVVRNLKKMRASIEHLEAVSKERSRKTMLWSLMLCTVLLVGGFFLIFWLLDTRFSGQEQMAAQQTTQLSNLTDDEEYAPTVIIGNDNAASSGVGSEESELEAVSVSDEATAPTSPSDILAMDKVTNTRYLTTMAKEHYGNYNFWPYIYLENEAKLGHPDRIKPGTTVVIPNIEKYNINPSDPKDIEKAKRLSVEIYKKYAHN